MTVPKFDRKKLEMVLDSIKNHSAGVGVLNYAFKKKLYVPAMSDLKNTGIYGTVVQNLVGPAYAGSGIADYLTVELKTSRLDSKSPITLGSFDFLDLKRDFESSSFVNKIGTTVFAFLKPSTESFIEPMTGFELPDYEIEYAESFDKSNDILFDTFKKDFESITDELRSRQPLETLVDTIFDNIKHTKKSRRKAITYSTSNNNEIARSALKYEAKYEDNSLKHKWRISKKFVLLGIGAHAVIDANPEMYDLV